MAKTIWKFSFSVTDHVRIEMPAGARPLAVQIQYDNPRLWAEVDPTADLETRDFFIYGTGQPMPDDPGQYVTTFQMMDGKWVWHLYEKKR